MTRALALAVALVALRPVVAVAADAGGLTALPAPPPPGPNVVRNGDFEARDGGAPAGWALDGDAWSVEVAGRGGGHALKLAEANRRRGGTVEQAVTLRPGLYTLEGWVKTVGVGASDKNTGVRLCLDARPDHHWWKCTVVVAGTHDWTRLRQGMISVPDAGTYRVTVGPYGSPDGVAWFDDVSLRGTRDRPLDAFLLYPNFHGLLFDDRPQTVRVALGVSEGDARDKGRVRLSLLDEPTGAVRASRLYPASPAFTGELDASALPAGPAIVRAELLDPNGEVAYRYPDYRIVKTPAARRAALNVWYDDANILHLGGKPAFVLGLYTTSGYSESRVKYADGGDGWGDARIAEAPVNMLINYWLGAAPIPALDVYMDDLASRGISYLHTVNFYRESDPLYRTIPHPAAKQGADALNRWVAEKLAAHRGFAGFYTADERPPDAIPDVFRQYREVRRAAPGAVAYAVVGNGWEQQARLWRDAVDVLGLDPYPITGTRGQNHLAMVGEWTRLGREAVMDSRPVWTVIQYFPMNGEAGWPTYDELRTMSWMAIVDGARGLLYWSFGAKGLAWVKDPKEKLAHWQDLVRVTKEIKALEPVLLAPDAALVTRESSRGRIRTLGKRLPDGRRFLFAYNSGAAPASVTWTLADPVREVVDLDLPATPVPINGPRLVDRLGPYEVKRYELR